MQKLLQAIRSVSVVNMFAIAAINMAAPVVIAADASAAERPGPSRELFANPYYSCVKNYYVATNGSDSNNGTSPSTPWLTLQKANDSGRVAGDCVNVAPGTYTNGVLITNGGNLAAKTGYVVYRCSELDACIVTGMAEGSNGSFAWKTNNNNPMTGSYVMIDGFTLAAAQETTFGQGIELWDGNENTPSAAPSVHHVWIINSMISGYGQSGVQMNDGEYFYVLHNTIYNNSRVGCAAQGSGVSFAGLKAFSTYVRTADDASNKMVGNIGTFNNAVMYNVLYNNAITQCGTQQHQYDTDGNNIIMDTLNNAGTTNVVYPGTVLIAFNVVYNAGGRGIHIFNSENITVANNSCYNSDLDVADNATYRPCIGDLNSYGNTFFNNIAWGITAAAPLNFNAAFTGSPSSNPPKLDTFTNNISYCVGAPQPYGGCDPMWGGDVFSCTSNMCDTSPVWMSVGNSSPGTEISQPLSANFALQPGSPAIGKGLRVSYLIPQSVDIGACPSTMKVCPALRNEP
jgi:parallel beta-helix repeat protein